MHPCISHPYYIQYLNITYKDHALAKCSAMGVAMHEGTFLVPQRCHNQSLNETGHKARVSTVSDAVSDSCSDNVALIYMVSETLGDRETLPDIRRPCIHRSREVG